MADPIAASEVPPAWRAFAGTAPLQFPRQGATGDTAFAGAFVIKRARSPLYRQWLVREYAVLQALGATGLPAPRPVALVERPEQVWLLMQRLPGEPLDVGLACATDRVPLLRSLGRMLRAIHQTPVPRSLEHEQPWIDRMLAAAEDNLAHHPVDGDAALLARLKRERPAPVPDCFIHGDAALDNFLFREQEISGVIDWAGGGPGDPRFDLALAIRAEPLADPAAFVEGYGGTPISDSAASWFLDLWDFF